jgi:hypothetical protein
MALVVEDGTGKADAESYAAVASADTYHTAFGNTAWGDLDTEAKEVALRKATRYIDSHYRFSGTKFTAAQALEWPREGAVDSGWYVESDAIPVKLVNATIELALIASTEDIMPTGSPGGAVIREKVDVLEVEYAVGYSGVTRYRTVDAALAGLVKSQTMGRVVRA